MYNISRPTLYQKACWQGLLPGIWFQPGENLTQKFRWSVIKKNECQQRYRYSILVRDYLQCWSHLNMLLDLFQISYLIIPCFQVLVTAQRSLLYKFIFRSSSEKLHRNQRQDTVLLPMWFCPKLQESWSSHCKGYLHILLLAERRFSAKEGYNFIFLCTKRELICCK